MAYSTNRNDMLIQGGITPVSATGGKKPSTSSTTSKKTTSTSKTTTSSKTPTLPQVSGSLASSQGWKDTSKGNVTNNIYNGGRPSSPNTATNINQQIQSTNKKPTTSKQPAQSTPKPSGSTSGGGVKVPSVGGTGSGSGSSAPTETKPAPIPEFVMPEYNKLDPFEYQQAQAYDEWVKANGGQYKDYAEEQKQLALDASNKFVNDGRVDNQLAYEQAVKNSRDDYFRQYAGAMESTGGMTGGLAQQFNDGMSMSQQQVYNDLHSDYRGNENELSKYQAQASMDAQKIYDEVYRGELDKNYDRYYNQHMTDNSNKWNQYTYENNQNWAEYQADVNQKWNKYTHDVGQSNWQNEFDWSKHTWQKEYDYRAQQDAYNRQMQQAQMQAQANAQRVAQQNAQIQAQANAMKQEQANAKWWAEQNLNEKKFQQSATNDYFSNYSNYQNMYGNGANMDSYNNYYNSLYGGSNKFNR